MTIFVALSAAIGIAGVFLVIAGLPAARARHRLRGGWATWSRPRRLRAGIGLVAGLIVTFITGFVPALVLIPALAVVLPELLASQSYPDLDLMEALDRWVRLLTASVRTGKSVADAMRTTLNQVPQNLAEPVRTLLVRLDERWTLRDGLHAMADELDSADADAVLAALILVGERGGVGASTTLAALSDALQDRLKAMREIVGERAKPQVVVRQVTAITLISLAAGLVLTPSYFAAYTTALGQLLLLALGAGYLACLVTLRQIATPRRRERILSHA